MELQTPPIGLAGIVAFQDGILYQSNYTFIVETTRHLTNSLRALEEGVIEPQELDLELGFPISFVQPSYYALKRLESKYPQLPTKFADSAFKDFSEVHRKVCEHIVFGKGGFS